MATVQSVRIGLLNAEDIKERAVCEVTETSMMLRGHPKEQGVTDVRFGSTGRFQTCGTCLLSIDKCAGHTGFIDLLYPLPHIGLLDRLVKTLNVTCTVCTKLLLETPVGGLPSTMLARTHVAVTKLKRRVKLCTCPHCGAPQGRVYLSEPFLMVEWKPDTARRLQGGEVNGWTVARWKDELKDCMTNWRASYLLRGMDPTTLHALGVVNPESTHVDGMLMRALLVPAIVTRLPPASDDGDGHAREQHALSKRLCEIVKHQRAVQQALASVKQDLTTHPVTKGTALFNALRMLYYHVSNYLMPGKTNIPDIKLNPYAHHPDAKAVSVIKNLEGGKTGRFRGSLMGKRVNFGARGVITSGAHLDVDEIGVPRRIAKYLTEPVTITPHNRHLVKELIEQGEIGQLIDPDTGTIIGVKDREQPPPLINGWVAERFLHDGTYVIMNRQPTLHLVSMMAHRVKVIEGDTFQLPPSVTAPYNADFDGDEMNMHVVQTHAARAELRELSHVARNVLHPRANKPCIGLIQDHLVAAYNLCHEPRLTLVEAVKLLSVVKYHPDAPEEAPMGHAASLLPTVGGAKVLLQRLGPLRSVYTGRDLVSCITPACVSFTKGTVRVERGVLCSGVLNSATLGATHGGYIHHATLHGGGNVAVRMVSDMQRLFGEYMMRRYGFSFGPADMATDVEDDDAVAQVIAQAEAYTQRYHDNEGAKCNALRQVVTHVAEIVSNRRKAATSAFQRMATHVQSKGSAFNAGQSMGCVGQTMVGGQRIGVGSRKRVLPDEVDDLTQHGFVRRSFKRGLRPMEAFLNNAGGREGLIDTSVKTQTTGYFERCMMKFLENVRVEADGAVRDAESKEQLQPRFGDDGLDQRRLIRVSLPALLHTNEQLGHDTVLVQMRNRLQRYRVSPFTPNLVTNTDVYVPFDMAQLVTTERAWCETGCGDDALSNKAVVDALCAALDHQPFLEFHVRTVALTLRACTTCWQRACDAAMALYRVAHVTTGDAVGALVGSSTGEPATQMALSAFHFAGSDLKGTQGVPRLKEIINATQNITTPILSFSVATLDEAHHHAATLIHTFLRDVVTEACVATLPEDDLARQHESVLTFMGVRPWCMRFVLDKPMMQQRALDPHAIADTIRNTVSVHDMLVCTSLPESETWEVRVYLYEDNQEEERKSIYVPLHGRRKSNAREAAEWLALRTFQQQLLTDTHVCGLDGVTKTAVRRMDVTVLDDDTPRQEERIMVDVQGARLMPLWLHLESSSFSTWFVSNDILDVCATLGVDAASAVLYNELLKCNAAAGTRVDEHLARLLTDAMTHYGFVMPISRHGMNRIETKSILAKISFEEAVQGLMDAAPRGIVDPLDGVSARLMVGKDIPVGTQLVGDTVLPTPRGGEASLPVTSCCDDEMPCGDVERWVEQHGVPLMSETILPSGAVSTSHHVVYDLPPRREFRVSSPEPCRPFVVSSPPSL